MRQPKAQGSAGSAKLSTPHHSAQRKPRPVTARGRMVLEDSRRRINPR